MKSDRIIFHIDGNNYFASVEEALFPELRKAPMAICNSPASKRGVILAKNQPANQYGIQTGESVFQALRKCPNLVLRPARRDQYQKRCELLNGIYAQYSDLLERASIDESYLDVTNTLPLFGNDARQLAHQIRERVWRELDQTVSVGVSFNKIFAKIASDMKKPNAVTIITQDNFKELLWPLPVSTLPMVGQANEAILLRMGIRTIGDLALTDPRRLREKLGKVGEHLHTNANGRDSSPVRHMSDSAEIQSVGSGRTFEDDLTRPDEIKRSIAALSDNVATELRRKGLKCLTVQLTVKDPNFKVHTRQKGLPNPTWLAADLSEACIELLEAFQPPRKPVRMLTVTALKLIPKNEAGEQLSFFQSPDASASHEKQEKLELTVDRIRQKYGASSISTAGSVLSGSNPSANGDKHNNTGHQ